MWSNGGCCRLFLCLALAFAGSPLWCQQEIAPLPQTLNDKQLIERLLKDLTDSSQEATSILRDSQLQLLTFGQLKAAYNSLAVKLPSYERTITDLQRLLDQSDTSLSKAQQDLAQAQRQAEDLQRQLATLSSALSNYKSATDKEVRNLEMQRNAWKIAGITLGIATAAETVYIIGHAMKSW